MFNTADYLMNDPWTGLIRMISDRTYLVLSPSHCILTELKGLGGLRTQVTFRPERSTANSNILPPLPAELSYVYTRLDPAQYIGTRTVGGLKVPTDTTAILQQLTQQTGITFSVDDFIAHEVTEYGSVELVSRPESLRWLGRFTVNLVNQTAKALSQVISQPVLGNVFLVPSTTDTRVVDTVYFGSTNFTPHRFALRALTHGINGLHPDHLAAILTTVTGDPWVCRETPAPFNLCTHVTNGVPQVRILYSGRPVRRYTTRTDKRSVVVLDTNETLCTGFKGRVLLHYD